MILVSILSLGKAVLLTLYRDFNTGRRDRKVSAKWISGPNACSIINSAKENKVPYGGVKLGNGLSLPLKQAIAKMNITVFRSGELDSTHTQAHTCVHIILIEIYT